MDDGVEVSAMAINVTVPERRQWTDSRRGEEFLLTTLNVRMLPDGTLAAKAYGRPTAGGRGHVVGPPRPLLKGSGEPGPRPERRGPAGCPTPSHSG